MESEEENVWNTQLDEIYDFLCSEIPNSELGEYILKITQPKQSRDGYAFNVILKNGSDTIPANNGHEDEVYDIGHKLNELLEDAGYTDFLMYKRFRTDRHHVYYQFRAYQY